MFSSSSAENSYVTSVSFLLLLKGSIQSDFSVSEILTALKFRCKAKDFYGDAF